MNDQLEVHHALVCGASSGIGRAVAMMLARRGLRVTALARRERPLRELVGTLDESAGYVLADLDDQRALDGIVSGLLETRGPVHVLVNNTGGPPPGRLLDAKPADLLAAFTRHVLSAQRLVRALLPGMVEAGYGRIVNIISTSVREPIPNLGVSNTVRAAMAGWSKTLSHELPPGVTINNVLPGYTDTGRLRALGESVAERRGVTPEQVREDWIAAVPEGRLGHPKEVAAVVAFLCSEEAAYVRGQSLAVDGGRMRSI